MPLCFSIQYQSCLSKDVILLRVYSRQACATQIRACLEEERVKYVFLSVNIDTNHWICLVIDLDAKKIYVYDSVKSRIISKVMAGLAKKLMRQVLKDKYTEQVIKTPTQKDCNSCGIFVCRYFGLCDSSEAPTDLTPTGIERLRCMGWLLRHSCVLPNTTHMYCPDVNPG
ncbi:hypothetical protein PC116_g24389 [Phytophthora cactorum]|uniref:Uncharacterized protein n=2 Tax=Phytophthora cactorum TaxID=29920 RepID=A0A8T1BDZ0_9STRA|nr:hypothetical protein PC111_g19619 [Phytophthora cactorum]KAG2900068.1 hypothetical protein PC117_g22073 [Phytophthora cactorum]KAG2978099.1 hypothetical protein PC119_g21831 [Phytophthora cactorum]KAG3133147.1 hypothetical protein C6341_g22654 [Phytophthora cactorum]KAG4227216.1 hypothetical protein PC116_g24389 [Phytophthora cactorum]